jgi:exopolyphosphatase/guanosine-5'-triphosphate,3'-diphosphate pyrophosphatase
VIVHLVRHARAVANDEWEGEDLLRPLTERGFSEAEALAKHFAENPPARIVSAPELRCQQTLEALAIESNCPIEVDDRLAVGEGVRQVLELFPSGDNGGAVLLCTHAQLIASTLSTLELADAARGERVRCKKGSVWTLEGGGAGPTRANYFEPIARTSRNRRHTYEERGNATTRTVRAAVLDLGSTSFTLLVADVNGEGEIQPLVREKVMLRLGASMKEGANISESVARRSVSVARQLHAVAEQEKVVHFAAVATSAIREAANGAKVASRISRAIGEPVRVLSGEQEARFVFHAFRQRLDLGSEPTLGLDLGGGSLEIVVGNAERIEFEMTLPLGAVRVTSGMVHSDPISKADARAIRAHVRSHLSPHRGTIRRKKLVLAIAAGGAVRALGRLVAERTGGRRVSKMEISADQLAQISDDLLASTHDERLEMRGASRQRADLLPVGALILRTLVDDLRLDGLTICDWGLREGVLLDAVAREVDEPVPS